MKQVKFIFILAAMVALSVGFSSCRSDDDNPLVGTSWAFTDSGDGWSETVTIRFVTNTSGTITESVTESGVTISESLPMTYTFDDPAVAITFTEDGVSITLHGTVSGTRLTLTAFGETVVFTRQ